MSTKSFAAMLLVMCLGMAVVTQVLVSHISEPTSPRVEQAQPVSSYCMQHPTSDECFAVPYARETAEGGCEVTWRNPVHDVLLRDADWVPVSTGQSCLK